MEDGRQAAPIGTMANGVDPSVGRKLRLPLRVVRHAASAGPLCINWGPLCTWELPCQLGRSWTLTAGLCVAKQEPPVQQPAKVTNSAHNRANIPSVFMVLLRQLRCDERGQDRPPKRRDARRDVSVRGGRVSAPAGFVSRPVGQRAPSRVIAMLS